MTFCDENDGDVGLNDDYGGRCGTNGNQDGIDYVDSGAQDDDDYSGNGCDDGDADDDNDDDESEEAMLMTVIVMTTIHSARRYLVLIFDAWSVWH